MSLQDMLIEIHHKYGTSEMANYKIQLLFDKLLEESNKTWIESREQTAKLREKCAIRFMLDYYVDIEDNSQEMEDKIIEDYYTRGRDKN